MPRIIYARADEPSEADPPDADPIMSLRGAIAVAEPDTEIRLLPGRFTTKIRIRRLKGREGAPIVIKGYRERTIIDGKVDPKASLADRSGVWPRTRRSRDNLSHHKGRKTPFFRVERSSWIEWRDLWVENCWPYFLNMSGCHHITVAGCRVRGATYAIFLKDKKSRKPSHHILVENNIWCQDPTGDPDPANGDPTDRLSWQDWTWHEMKKDPKPFPGWENLTFMNGGFVGGTDAAGCIVIRRNEMRFAFNAIRLEVFEEGEREPLRKEHQGDAPDLSGEEFNYTPPDLDRNRNVEIYENLIEYIRDNAIEPEFGSTNWWVWDNRMRNVHKAISIHNNGGGYWYFFGNVAGTEAVPPAQINEPPEWRKDKPIRKLGGKIFKFFYGPPLPRARGLAMHNSWRPRGGVVTGGGEMRHFQHFNNAMEHCAPADPGADIRCPSTPSFAERYDAGTPFDYGFATLIEPQTAEAENCFDRDVSNGADFPETPQVQNQELNGIKAKTEVFDRHQRERYVLAAGSPARGLAAPVTLRGGVDWPAEEDWQSIAPDAGAVQPDGHFKGPAFAHLPSRFYDEAPRLTGLEPAATGAVLVFCVPLDLVGQGVEVSRAALFLDDGSRLPATGLASAGRRLALDTGGAVEVEKIVAIALPKGLTGGHPGKSLPVTAWAALLPTTIA